MKFIRILFFILACGLLAVISYSGYQLWDIHQNHVQEAEIHSRLMQFRPEAQGTSLAPHRPESTPVGADESASDDAPVPRVNQSIVDLQTAHPGAVGWLTVPNTQIDYPFAQGENNATYLHLDLDGRWSAAGTLFMDFRNSRDFSDFNTILFGHHMRNGSMFGTLQSFNNQAFFEENRTGTIFLADKTYAIDFFAFAVIEPDDGIIYDSMIQADGDKAAFLAHVNRAARYYRDVDVTPDDRIVTLSTCNYEFDDARMVLIGKLTEISVDSD